MFRFLSVLLLAGSAAAACGEPKAHDAQAREAGVAPASELDPSARDARDARADSTDSAAAVAPLDGGVAEASARPTRDDTAPFDPPDAARDAAPAPADPDCPVIVSDSQCDRALRPIVFVHGNMGAGDNAEHLGLLFGSNGYCQERFVAVDYNSLGELPHAKIDAAIAVVLAQTGADQVDLIGHSQGALWAYDYLLDGAHAARVANYVHIAGGDEAGPPHGVRTLSLSSRSDPFGVSQVAGSARVVVFDDHDHMGVAMSTESFVEIYRFLEGKDPQYTEVQCGDEDITLLGKAETFGDNTPLAGGRLEVFELGGAPRQRTNPVATFTTGADGSIGPLQLKRGVHYELSMTDLSGRAIGRMYYTPFKRSDYLTRVLVPSQHLVTSVVTDAAPRSPAHSILIARYNQRALRADLGDSLTVNGLETLTLAQANAATTTVAYFMMDDNGNGMSELGALPIYALLPFVKATDVYMPTSPPAFLEVSFNGASVKVPNWPSDPDGFSLIVFQ